MSQTDFNVLSPEGPSSRQEIFTAEAAEYIDLSSPTPQGKQDIRPETSCPTGSLRDVRFKICNMIGTCCQSIC
jgi:hypothetical protein